jgi:hypothetical protein
MACCCGCNKALLFNVFLRGGRFRKISNVGEVGFPFAATLNRGSQMRKTISTYWPVVILLPIALAFCMRAGENGAAIQRHEQTDVASVSAELARAISFGFVEADDATAATAIPAASQTL